jgi:hypothetical protein
MSDRTSINSDLSIFSSQDSAKSSDHVSPERYIPKDDIIQWFNDIGDFDLGFSQQPASFLDPAILYSFLGSPDYASWYNGTSLRTLVCRAESATLKVSQLSCC